MDDYQVPESPSASDPPADAAGPVEHPARSLGGSPPADKPEGKMAARRRYYRRTPPARRCTPPAGQTPKRKETCAGKNRVATEVKRRRKGHHKLQGDDVPSPATDPAEPVASFPKIRRNLARSLGGSPWPASPREHCRPTKHLAEEHRPPVDVCPRPIKRIRLRPKRKEGGKVLETQIEKKVG